MSKFTCLVVCIVAASLSGVQSQKLSTEERNNIFEAVNPIVTECAKEHGVSLDEVKAAQVANTEENLNSCFLACAFKKAGLINDQGIYNSDSALDVFKKFVKDDDYVQYQQKAKNCGSVNDLAVSDGEAGCDRAKHVLSCLFREQGVELVISN